MVFRLGNSWEEGIYSTDVLKESPLLPVPNPLRPYENRTETEPNYTVDMPETEKEFSCECNSSTNASSFNIEKNVDVSCSCSHAQMSISQDDFDDLKQTKERHMSIDSARDSGIGDNSNFTDLETKYDDTSDDNKDESDVEPKVYPTSKTESNGESSNAELRGLWQPKIKKSLADRLPPNSYHIIPPSRYIFPGAEVFYDPDDGCPQKTESSTSSSDSDSDSEDINI